MNDPTTWLLALAIVVLIATLPRLLMANLKADEAAILTAKTLEEMKEMQHNLEAFELAKKMVKMREGMKVGISGRENGEMEGRKELDVKFGDDDGGFKITQYNDEGGWQNG